MIQRMGIGAVLRVAYIAEIVGKAGISVVKKLLREKKQEWGVDFVIANGNGVTNGYGLGRNHAAYLRKLGIDLFTMGDAAFFKKDLVEQLDKLPYVVRPANISPRAPGNGVRVQRLPGAKIAVAVLLGQSGFGRLQGDSPLQAALELADTLRRETPYVVFDIHAQASAEKIALFRALDGKCSAVLGSHTRVQTADAQLSPAGTGFICDAGRTGSLDSVGGCEVAGKIAEYRTGIPDWTREAWENPVFQGVLLDLDESGSCKSIEAFNVPCVECVNDGYGKSGQD